MDFERGLTAILTALIAVIAAVLVRREMVADGPARQVPPPAFESEWRTVLGAASGGNDSAAVVQIVEFIDLQCPACRSYHRVLQSVKDQFRSRVAIRYVHLPLPYHGESYAAARAAECAGHSGKLEEFVSSLFAKQDSLGKKAWRSYARDAGVEDLSTFERCATDTSLVARVEAGLAAAKRLDITATPTILVHGWRFAGVPPEQILVKFIRDLLAGKVAVPASGVQTAGAVRPRRRIRDDGVVVLEHDAIALSRAPQLTIEAAPAAVVGGANVDVAYDVSNVTSVLLLANQRIVTFAPVESKLLLFDSSGRPVRDVVPRGKGPGELAGAPNVALGTGDTVLLPDLAELRLHWVIPDRGPVRTERLVGRLRSRGIRIVGALPGGRAVLSSAGYLREGRVGRVERPPMSVFVLPPSGEARVVAQVPGLETVTVATRYEGRAGIEAMALGFARSAHVLTWDTLIVTGSGEAYRLEMRNADGRVIQILSVAVPRRAVTASMRRADVTERLRQLAEYRERPRDPRESQRLIRELPYVDSLPPYSAIFASSRGRLWVVDAVSPGDSMWSATAFRADGAIVGRLRAFTKGLPIAFGDDRVVLRWVDEDGLVTLRVHRFVHSPR